MSDDQPIPAATIVLVRDAPRLEVLMIERHADIGFAGGALVFPGGRIDPGDADPDWRKHADGLPEDADAAAAAVAALREAFEETGMLLARAEDGAIVCDARVALVQAQRAQIEADDRLFLEMIRSEGLRLACDLLAPFAHWVPPPGLHKRFDTRFFIAIAPHGQIAREDGNEATEALWIAPGDAVAAGADGSRKVIFPTARNLELLALSDTARAALDHARARADRTHSACGR